MMSERENANQPATGLRVRRRILLLLGVHHVAVEEAVIRYSKEAGWMLDNTYTRGGRVPLWWQGDGMITLITTPKDYKALQMLPSVPLVDISRAWTSSALPPKMRSSGIGVPRILYDNPEIGRLAAEHFLERGITDIAFFNYGNFWMETERIPAFRTAVEAGGANYHEIDYHRHFSLDHSRVLRDERGAHEWLVRELARLPKPIGIFTPGDEVAITLMGACESIGLAVPDDVAILGCSNTRILCDHAPVSLSSMDVNLDALGFEAARLLDQILDGKPVPPEPMIVPPVGVIGRDSTNVQFGKHGHLARALRFIQSHYRESIQTQDVAAASGISLRTLQAAFRKHLKRTIAAEILHHRIEHAKVSLVKSTRKAHEIAGETGFSSMVHFSEAFLRVTGTRPSQFRLSHRMNPPQNEVECIENREKSYRKNS